MPRRRSRGGSPGQGCRRQNARSSVGSSTQPSKELAPPMRRCRQQRAPVVRRGKLPPPRSKVLAPAPSPMPPPAGPTPRPASCHVAATSVCGRRQVGGQPLQQGSDRLLVMTSGDCPRKHSSAVEVQIFLAMATNRRNRPKHLSRTLLLTR